MTLSSRKSHGGRPSDTPFQQQKMQAWQPILTPKWVIITFTCLGVLFIPIGIVILSISNSVVEIVQRYDDICPPPPSDCNVTLVVPKDMVPPIYFYYQLTNFYQNHRRYVKSRSDSQLRGVGDLSAADLAACDPIIFSPVDPTKVLYPCGLIANSFFTDQFNASITSDDGTNREMLGGANWNKNGIAWRTDVTDKFKNPRKAYEGITRETTRPGIPGIITLPEVTDEEFIVWMRTAGLPTFKKLNRIIGDRTLAAGTLLNIAINNQFPVSGFNGEKAIVLSTTSILGGKNPFLGYAYTIIGSICLALAAGFLAKHYHSPRTLGDMTYFTWNQADRRVHSHAAINRDGAPNGTVYVVNETEDKPGTAGGSADQ